MDSVIVILGSASLAAAVTGLFAWKLEVFQNWRRVMTVIRLAVTDPPSILGGVLGSLIYLFVFMVFGGQGGRVHMLFGRWIFNMTPGDAVVGFIVTLLIGVSMALFIFTVRKMGLFGARKQGGVGAAGSLLALVASFCP